jgi:hypothetical protein
LTQIYCVSGKSCDIQVAGLAKRNRKWHESVVSFVPVVLFAFSLTIEESSAFVVEEAGL